MELNHYKYDQLLPQIFHLYSNNFTFFIGFDILKSF